MSQSPNPGLLHIHITLIAMYIRVHKSIMSDFFGGMGQVWERVNFTWAPSESCSDSAWVMSDPA